MLQAPQFAANLCGSRSSPAVANYDAALAAQSQPFIVPHQNAHDRYALIQMNGQVNIAQRDNHPVVKRAGLRSLTAAMA
jgi:hypothetical protein